MTVNTISSVAEFDTNGVTTNYPFYFKFLANEDLVVTYVDPDGVSLVMTYGTDYTVNGVGKDDGGSIVTTTALPGPGQLVVSREMEAFQQTSLRNQGKFLAETHEDVFDKLTMLVQQGFSLFRRALIRPLGRDYYDAENRRIANVRDPVEQQDAATKSWVGSFVDSVSGLINNTLGIAYDAGNLFDYLKFGNNRTVDSIAALRALSSSRNQRATVLGYYGKGDGGGGVYYVDLLDLVSIDNGGSLIVANDGARWKLSQVEPTDVRQFGAINNGFAGTSAHFQKVFDIGGTHTVKDGTYRLGQTVTSSYAAADFPEVGFPSKRLSLLGNSSANTIFVNDVQTGSKLAIKLEGTIPGSGSQGVHAQDRIGHFSMIRAGGPSPTGPTGTGLYILNKSMFNVDDIHFQFMDVAVELDGCLSATLSNMRLLNGGCGLFIAPTANSLPNALTFNSLMAGGNARQGVLCNELGSGNVFIGGSIENNGSMLPAGGGPVAGHGGLRANLVGTNGTSCLTMIGVYFEGNAGEGDIYLDNITAFNLSVVLINCTFNRLMSSRFVDANINARTTGGGKLKITLIGCSFLSTGDYVPVASRPYIFTDGNVEIVGWDTCTYSESTSIPSYMKSSSSAVISGSVTQAGVLSGGVLGVTVQRVSAGIYNLDKAGGWGPNVDSYHVSVTPYGPEARIESVTKQNRDRVQVVFRSHTVAANVDVDFSFSATRTQ